MASPDIPQYNVNNLTVTDFFNYDPSIGLAR